MRETISRPNHPYSSIYHKFNRLRNTAPLPRMTVDSSIQSNCSKPSIENSADISEPKVQKIQFHIYLFSFNESNRNSLIDTEWTDGK